MKILRQLQLFSVSSVILLLAIAVSAQEYSIVPGKSVGPVRLGDARAAVIKARGKPTETKRLRSGLVKDSWLGAEPAPNSEDSQLFFNVISRAGRVVQIEFNDPKYKTATGISIESTLAQFRAEHKRPRVSAFTYDDGEGSGYVGYYYDDVRSGIAFSLTTQDYFDANVIPEAFRVHAAGQPVILDPGGKRTRANDEKPVQKTKSLSEHANEPQERGEREEREERGERLERGRESREIETVIKQFWEGMGRLDSMGMKKALDWPVMIVEAANVGNKQSVIRNPQEFDEAFKRTPESAMARGKSEFYGTRLSGFSVRMLNANLATVSYVCLLPKDIVAKNPASRSARFNAVTVLRREPERTNKWRIVFITVPK